MNTYRRAHDFDLPHEPRLVEVLFRLIVDIRMINPRLNLALALLIKLYRDSVCILHQERDISHGHSKRIVLTSRERQYTIPVSLGWCSSMYLAISRTAAIRSEDFGSTL